MSFPLLIAVTGTALAWSDRLVASYVLPKLLLLSAAVLGGGIALLAARGPAAVGPRRSPLDLPLALLLGATLVSALASRDPLVSVLGHFNANVHGLWPTTLFIAVFFMARTLDFDARWKLVQAGVWAAALVGGYAGLQGLGMEVFPTAGGLLGGRAISTIGGPVYLGAHLALFVPLALAGPRIRLALIVWGLFASGTRGAWLGAAAGAAAAWALKTGRFDKVSRREGPRIDRKAAFLAVGAAGLVAMYPGLWRRSYRWEMLKTAWDCWLAFPWLGGGPDTFELDFRAHKSLETFLVIGNAVEYQIHAHNDLAQAAATTGLLGLAAYLVLLAAVFLAWRRARADLAVRPKVDVCACALLALFVPMKFNPAGISALTMAAVLAASLAPEDKDAGTWSRGAFAGGLLALGLLSTAIAGRMTLADRAERRGVVLEAFGRREEARGHLETAARLSPCELEYRRTLVNHYIESGYGGGEKIVAPAFFDRAVAHAERAMGCHPEDMFSFYILGVSRLNQAFAVNAAAAAKADDLLEEALTRDPYYGPLVEASAKAAARRADAARTDELLERLAQIRAVP